MKRGGPTTQSGILYQNSITALYLGKLCDNRNYPDDEQVVLVRTEAPDFVDDTVITFADGHKKYIQAKENISTSSPKWIDLWGKVEKQYFSNNFDKNRDRIKLYFGTERFSHLKDLCICAQNSTDYDEWVSQLTRKSNVFLEKIKQNLSPKLSDKETLFFFISHIEIDIMSLDHCEEFIVPHAIPSTNQKPNVLFRILRDLVATKARVRGTFNSLELKTFLKKEIPDLIFKLPPDINTIKSEIRNINGLLLQHKHNFGSTDIHVQRPLVKGIVDWLETAPDDKNTSILLDQAGMGKSVIMRDVLLEAEKRGVFVLGIKSDLQLQDISTYKDFQEKLNLSYPIEQIISRLAKLNRVAILIDQIDALSIALAQDEKTLTFALDLLARLRLIPNVRILISCRLFDRYSDPRIREIETGKEFSIPKLSEEEIRSVLDNINVNYEVLSSATKILLQTPLHLNLFALAIYDSHVLTKETYGVNSLQELYNLLWQNVIFSNGNNTPSRANRNQVIDIIANYMDSVQKTTAPDSLFNQPNTSNLSNALTWLASSGIIIRSRTGWAFLHQTFADYYYARSFVEQGNDVVTTILESPQGLIERSRLSQVMTYLRGFDQNTYLTAYRKLLTSSKLRFHLQDLLLRWFGSLPNPTDDEWLLLQHFFRNSEKRHLYFAAISGNKAWFERIKDELLPNWLGSRDQELIDNCILPYLSSLIETQQKDIINLIEPYLNHSNIWLTRIASLITRTRHIHTIEAAELFEKVICKLPSIDQLVLYGISEVSKSFPKVGCRLIQFVLEYQNKDNATQNKATTPYRDSISFETSRLNEAIAIVATKEPSYFLEILLPSFMKKLNYKEISGKQDYWFEWDEFCENWNGKYNEVRNSLIFGLINSLIKISKTDLSNAQHWMDLLQNSPFTTPQRIVARVYTANPEPYVTQALDFLLADNRRLNLGEIANYDSRLLLRKIYPLLNSNERNRLENFILNYRPVYKHMGIKALNLSGLEQLYLLQTVSEQYLSQSGIKQLRELERKFPGVKAPTKESHDVTGGSITSPIPKDIADKMSDKNWISAISKYKGQFEHKDFLKGGAGQLSGVLKDATKNDPERFYQLMKSVPVDIDENYARAFIDGLAETENGEAEWMFDAIRYFSPYHGQKINRTISWAIEKRIDNVPTEVMAWLHNSVQDSEGEDEWWWSKGENHGDVYSSYLNSNRGAAFNTLIRVYQLLENLDAQNKQWTLIEYAASDSSTALRAGAIHHLTFLIRYDRERAISLFEKLISGHDILLTLQTTREFIYWAFYKNFDRLVPYIEKMMMHDNTDAKNQGAQLACIARISSEALESDHSLQKAKELTEKAITGCLEWRQGATRIFAHNLHRSPGDICEPYLIRLLEDEDEQVRTTIDGAFASLQYEHFVSRKNFIEAYAKTTPTIDHFFTDFLLKHGQLDHERTLKIIQNLIESVKKSNRPGWHSGTDEIIRLVLKIYISSPDSDIRRQAMDLFDELLEHFTGSAQKVLLEWDRQ